jgi:hypothetical protein
MIALGPSTQANSATSIAIAEVVLEMINSSPRTPSMEEIAEAVDYAMLEHLRYAGHNNYDAKAVAPVTFEALPVTFDETNDAFAARHLPWVRMAFAAVLERDDKGAFEVFVQMDAELQQKLAEGIDATRSSLLALTDLLGAAGARLLVMRARYRVQGRPDMSAIQEDLTTS